MFALRQTRSELFLGTDELKKLLFFSFPKCIHFGVYDLLYCTVGARHTN